MVPVNLRDPLAQLVWGKVAGEFYSAVTTQGVKYCQGRRKRRIYAKDIRKEY